METISNRWSTNVQFCPGYEFGCKLGVWYASRIGTTSSWYNSTSTNYHWEDDIGVVKVAPNPTYGALVTRVGGQESRSIRTRTWLGPPADIRSLILDGRVYLER